MVSSRLFLFNHHSNRTSSSSSSTNNSSTSNNNSNSRTSTSTPRTTTVAAAMVSCFAVCDYITKTVATIGGVVVMVEKGVAWIQKWMKREKQDGSPEELGLGGGWELTAKRLAKENKKLREQMNVLQETVDGLQDRFGARLPSARVEGIRLRTAVTTAGSFNPRLN
ncbi:serine/threonine protein kinase [Fusarium flagelliforme]|uniref:Serine/threonine protein kinase n=1 Tax=Fusarium flagelliforme TaxID=2675880 RepID=A0A395MJR2_9HYPO|nr:serine/threonine protein kinase [Fusarium flagelliforme]